MAKKRIKALGLISGGLDSFLALKLIKRQGIETAGVCFQNPFIDYKKNDILVMIRREARNTGFYFLCRPLRERYLKVIKTPKHGYGKNMNPCIDCRIYMLKAAKRIMKNIGADFLFTGEVVGQRPMSQKKKSLMLVEKESGLEGKLLRPLSAKLLPATIAEKKGWVEREKLMAIEGRQRGLQLELAKEWGIKYYGQPAGGCLLTDPNFSRRLKDLLNSGDFELSNINLLKAGRHFRIDKHSKLIVGRDESDNLRMRNMLKKGDIAFETLNLPGPFAIGRGDFTQKEIKFSAGIIARYTSRQEPVIVGYRRVPDEPCREISSRPLEEEKIENKRIS
ncbi:MAG: tRNA 4-thiouridine(8) synthase ThiI [Candidatus Omnitrophica bacterium]|nr:tRNA 4-thiouridine(8) synthase ThiI [Candidatus Omnitrophota bacterium]MBD3269186.1 tRNA 4-thiouridine(8) synthase ThiI [Candidatus Omnitrophota bacterium]